MRSGYLAMAVVVMIWAAFALTMRASEHSTLSTGDVAFLRFGVAASVLLPSTPRTLKVMRSQNWKWTALIIIGGGLPFFILAQLGSAQTSAALLGTVAPGTVPIFLALFGAFMGTRYNGLRWLGVGSIALGVVIAMVGSSISGILLLLCAGGVWSLYALAVSKTAYKPLDIAVLLAVPSAVGTLVLAATGVYPLTIFSGTAALNEVLFYALMQGVIIGVLSTVLYSYAITHIGASRASLLGAASPVLSTFMAIPLLGEIPALPSILCLAFVCLGVIVVSQFGHTLSHKQTRSLSWVRLRVRELFA